MALREGGKLRHRLFPNSTAGFSQLSDWLKKQRVKRVHACMEATGTYGDSLAAYLHEQGHTVSIVNPAAIKAYAPQPPLAHQDRPRGRRANRRLLLGAAAPGLAAARARSTGTASACAPP